MNNTINLFIMTLYTLIPTHRRIRSSDTTYFYDGGILFMDITAITGTISSIKTALDIIKTTYGFRKNNDILIETNKIWNEVASLHVALIGCRNEHSALEAKCREFEKQIADLKRQLDDSLYYQPHQFESGAIAYIDTRLKDGTIPALYFCATCYHEAKKTILQPLYADALCCPVGHPTISTQKDRPLEYPF